ncbi:MAG: NAD(P)/FAD-dependent oxidoreductase [Oscillospiraceae bacterium]|nr:NAD(P)/FAD-dependent oxidoreductase [Oscillospiraceae bacterium]
MKLNYPNLCSPITIGNVTFRNRMFSAPMSGAEITSDCCIGRSSTAFYELRAKGGAANVTVSEVMVDPDTDGSHSFHLVDTNEGSIPSFTITADAIKRHGAIPSLELSHSGQSVRAYTKTKERQEAPWQWGPSSFIRRDGVQSRELSVAQIQTIVRKYGETAALAKRCGYEMIMVHAGHGWLLNQFFSPDTNHRTDQYGGSLENRVRFCIEVLQAIREAVGQGFPIELRISGDEFFEGGYHLEEAVEIAKLVEPYIDLLHVSAGSYMQGFGRTHPSMFLPHGVNVYLAAEIKKHVSVPVATLGGLNDPAQMEEIIASGQADVIYMARALLADHELPRKVMANREEDIVRCLRCFTCMAERVNTSTRRCAVNPMIGRELDGMEILPARVKRRVLVVGAGPAGLKAAQTAAIRGHQVILCEKEPEVGGILREEQAIPFKYEMYQLGLTLERLCRQEGVEFRMNTLVTPEYVEQEAPDALIVAVGSSPIVPPIPGLKGDNVILVNSYYLEQDRVKDTVVVLGGGLAGCETAIHLARQGKQVALVEMRPELAPDANCRHRPILLEEIRKQGIRVCTGHKGLRVTSEGVITENPAGQEALIPGETVICALGQRSNTTAANALRGTAPYVAVVGDAWKVANITAAIYQGYHAALDI